MIFPSTPTPLALSSAGQPGVFLRVRLDLIEVVGREFDRVQPIVDGRRSPGITGQRWFQPDQQAIQPPHETVHDNYRFLALASLAARINDSVDRYENARDTNSLPNQVHIGFRGFHQTLS
ncbi:hypothetical protein [Burkholderia gladioli]|uniref:hypothetical protein n=1 Tax=Burkholderia gladioli TaxID=28095 RepID=UPI00163FF7E8|nr:hypothetical protein [Burkholderia gladioli]